MILRKLFWQLYLSFLAILCVLLAAVIVYAQVNIRRDYRDAAVRELTSQINVLRTRIVELLEESNYERLDQLCRRVSAQANLDLTVLLLDGRVVADSIQEPWQVALDEMNVRDVERMIQNQAHSRTFENQYLTLYFPLGQEESVPLAYVRASRPVAYIDDKLSDLNMGFLRYGLVLTGLGALVGLWVTRRISGPVENMTRSAMLMAEGDLSARLNGDGSDEFGSLANAINKMARQLDERIDRLEQNRNELSTVLSSMAEGVIALNGDGELVTVNQAACELLGLEADKVLGKSVEETIWNPDLQDFIRNAIVSGGNTEADIFLPDMRNRYVHVYGRILEHEESGEIKAIIVLNNITQIRRLENIRRDFVANVSHELKTPITSIKGFVETLLDGAIDKPEEAKRFLRIVARHTNRLNAIIEDILILSRIEEEAGRSSIPREPGNVRDPIESAVETCFMKAQDKNIRIEVDCGDVRAEMNEFMLEQALVNLIDNAIKYSDEGSRIWVSAAKTDDHVAISVRDSGYGIAEEHLDRIFERFYVTDKARSRTLGGTGLGLAIVKHIAQAHDGYVDVKSRAGEGSTFTIYFPAEKVPESGGTVGMN